MSATVTAAATASDECKATSKLRGLARASVNPTDLSDIYRSDTNIAVWQRQLPGPVQQEVAALLAGSAPCEVSLTTSPERVRAALGIALPGAQIDALVDDIAELVEMYTCLFEWDRVGLRLTALTRAMCPRFHVDNVPCRMVTTYQGQATQWLKHQVVNRERLGRGSEGKPDDVSGLYASAAAIEQLAAGDVALLKGERWLGNEGAGLVHRSPALEDGERRLLLTLDMA